MQLALPQVQHSLLHPSRCSPSSCLPPAGLCLATAWHSTSTEPADLVFLPPAAAHQVMLGDRIAQHMRVFAGDCVPKKKPAPDIYNLAAKVGRAALRCAALQPGPALCCNAVCRPRMHSALLAGMSRAAAGGMVDRTVLNLRRSLMLGGVLC